MRGRTTLVLAALTAAAVTCIGDVTYAQLSPQGVIGGITRPFRHVLGRLGHYPRARHHRAGARAASARAAAAESRAAQGGPRETPGASGYRLGRGGPPARARAYEGRVGLPVFPRGYVRRPRGPRI